MRERAARLLGLLRLAVGLGLLGYVLVQLAPSTIGRLRATPLWLLPAMSLLPFVGALAEAVRMRLLFGAQGIQLPIGVIFRVALMAAFFNVCIPGITAGGDVMRVFFFSTGRSQRAVEVVAVLVVDRLVSLLGLLTVILALSVGQGAELDAHAALRWVRGGCALTAAAVLLVGALASSQRLRSGIDGLLGRLPFGSLVKRFADGVQAYRSEPRVLVLAWLASLPGHLVLAAMFALAAHVLLPAVPGLLAADLSLVALLANVLPLTPGGLGVGELAFDRLFAALGHDGGAALQLAWRAAMLPAIASGGALYALGKWRSRQAEARPASKAPGDAQ